MKTNKNESVEEIECSGDGEEQRAVVSPSVGSDSKLPAISDTKSVVDAEAKADGATSDICPKSEAVSGENKCAVGVRNTEADSLPDKQDYEDDTDPEEIPEGITI